MVIYKQIKNILIPVYQEAQWCAEILIYWKLSIYLILYRTCRLFVYFVWRKENRFLMSVNALIHHCSASRVILCKVNKRRSNFTTIRIQFLSFILLSFVFQSGSCLRTTEESYYRVWLDYPFSLKFNIAG